MKTICILDGKIIMSQNGDSLVAMQANASQYAGAVASVISDADYAIFIAAEAEKIKMASAVAATARGNVMREVNTLAENGKWEAAFKLQLTLITGA